MQRQLAQMTAQANEARSLAAAAEGVMPTGGALKDALAKSLADNGMPPTQVQVIGAAVQIQLKNASFPKWTMWLDDVRKQFKVQVVRGARHGAQARRPGGSDGVAAAGEREMRRSLDAHELLVRRACAALPWSWWRVVGRRHAARDDAGRVDRAAVREGDGRPRESRRSGRLALAAARPR